MGRVPGERWAPRIIDLDIILCEESSIVNQEIEIPHKGLKERSFVLAPLRDIIPNYEVDGKSVLSLNRRLENPIPAWMGIINVTEDSFSDGGTIRDEESFLKQLNHFSQEGVQIIDVGAESTRPGARAVEARDEWGILKPFLKSYNEFKKTNKDGPMLSVDTRHSFVASRAIEFGASFINDVSALKDPEMISLLKDSDCQYIFMHSLSTPADPQVVIPLEEDPVLSVSHWLEEKINFFEKNNIKSERLIFDPGIGFGKTPQQSLRLMKNMERFKTYPLRSLVGHSRKSFMKSFSGKEAIERDMESVGMSLVLSQKAVDIIRVHNPSVHMKAHRGWSHVL